MPPQAPPTLPNAGFVSLYRPLHRESSYCQNVYIHQYRDAIEQSWKTNNIEVHDSRDHCYIDVQVHQVVETSLTDCGKIVLCKVPRIRSFMKNVDS